MHRARPSRRYLNDEIVVAATCLALWGFSAKQVLRLVVQYCRREDYPELPAIAVDGWAACNDNDLAEVRHG
jgi:hypothetical protein